MRRTLPAALIAAAVVTAAGFSYFRAGRDALPPRIRVDEVLLDLGASLERATILQQAVDAPVRRDALAPRHRPSGRTAHRSAIVAPAPASLRYRLRVPPRAALELAAGVAAPDRVPDGAAPIAFRATIDGREAFAQVIDPREETSFPWHEARIDLADAAGREVDLVLATRAVGDGPPAGTAGWSRIRLVGTEWHERQRASASAPSVVVLLVDSLRADELGCYGATPSPTPNTDMLASTGVVFEQAIAQAPWTLPAVATLFTGLYPGSHGVVGGSWRWGAPDPDADTSRSVLADGVPTLAALARRAGITTAGFTASGLVSPTTGLTRGFEHFVELTGNPSATRFARAEALNRRLLAWLAENRAYRTFAYVHYMDTHAPYEPPAEFGPPVRADLPEAVRAGRTSALRREPVPAEHLAHLRALYAGTVRYWDTELGRLRRGLADLGVADSTVLVVIADHGEGFQEHGYLGHGVHLHEQLVHVPFVVAGPGVGAPRRVTEQVEQADFLPTVAALLGVDPPPGLPGQHVLAPFTERPAVASTVYWEAPDGSRAELLALRTRTWKLLHAPAAGHYELYDLARDPTERVDVFAMRPEGARLASALSGWRARLPPAPAAPDDAPELGPTLHALGYVE